MLTRWFWLALVLLTSINLCTGTSLRSSRVRRMVTPYPCQGKCIWFGGACIHSSQGCTTDSDTLPCGCDIGFSCCVKRAIPVVPAVPVVPAMPAVPTFPAVSYVTAAPAYVTAAPDTPVVPQGEYKRAMPVVPAVPAVPAVSYVTAAPAVPALPVVPAVPYLTAAPAVPAVPAVHCVTAAPATLAAPVAKQGEYQTCCAPGTRCGAEGRGQCTCNTCAVGSIEIEGECTGTSCKCCSEQPIATTTMTAITTAPTAPEPPCCAPGVTCGLGGTGRCTPYQCSANDIEVQGDCKGSNCRCCCPRPIITTIQTTRATEPICGAPGVRCGLGGTGRCTPYQCSADDIEVQGECKGSNCRCCCPRPIITTIQTMRATELICGAPGVTCGLGGAGRCSPYQCSADDIEIQGECKGSNCRCCSPRPTTTTTTTTTTPEPICLTAGIRCGISVSGRCTPYQCQADEIEIQGLCKGSNCHCCSPALAETPPTTTTTIAPQPQCCSPGVTCGLSATPVSACCSPGATCGLGGTGRCTPYQCSANDIEIQGLCKGPNCRCCCPRPGTTTVQTTRAIEQICSAPGSTCGVGGTGTCKAYQCSADDIEIQGECSGSNCTCCCPRPIITTTATTMQPSCMYPGTVCGVNNAGICYQYSCPAGQHEINGVCTGMNCRCCCPLTGIQPESVLEQGPAVTEPPIILKVPVIVDSPVDGVADAEMMIDVPINFQTLGQPAIQSDTVSLYGVLCGAGGTCQSNGCPDGSIADYSASGQCGPTCSCCVPLITETITMTTQPTCFTPGTSCGAGETGRCSPYQCSEDFVEIPGECQGSNCRCCFPRPTTTTTTTTQPSCFNPGTLCGAGGTGRCTPYQCSEDFVEIPGECRGSNCRCCCPRPTITTTTTTATTTTTTTIQPLCSNPEKPCGPGGHGRCTTYECLQDSIEVPGECQGSDCRCCCPRPITTTTTTTATTTTTTIITEPLCSNPGIPCGPGSHGRCTPYQCLQDSVEVPGECLGSDCRCCCPRPFSTTIITTAKTIDPSCFNTGTPCGPGGNGRCSQYQCSTDTIEIPGECTGSNCRCCCPKPTITPQPPGRIGDSCINNPYGVCSANCDNPTANAYGQCNDGAVCCNTQYGIPSLSLPYLQSTQPALYQSIKSAQSTLQSIRESILYQSTQPTLLTLQSTLQSPRLALYQTSAAPWLLQSVTGVPNIKLKVVIYYESMCTDCRSFFSNSLVPAYKQLREIFTVDLVPYGKTQTLYDPSGKPKFECQFGSAMCEADRVHACVVSTPMDEAIKIDIINCMEQSNDKSVNPLQVGQICMRKEADLWKNVKGCVTSEEADWLLDSFGTRTQTETHIRLNPNTSRVPYVTIDGKEITDYDHFIHTLCKAYNGPRPERCQFQD